MDIQKEYTGLMEAFNAVYENQEQLDEAMSSYDRNRQRAAQRAAARNEARKQGKTGNVPGVGYVSPRPERETYRDSAGVERHKTGARMPKKEDQKESFDFFDVILEHLVSEGYADTNEAALAIMANMSEDWKQSIVEAPGEWFGGLRDRARASKAAQIQSMQPKPKPGPNVSSPFAKPASRTDSGKLTTYGAGGGAAAERAGQTRAQVMQQGAKNLETRSKSNPGPNFGR